jgi:tetratricopeptide (TPR) repeat protein
MRLAASVAILSIFSLGARGASAQAPAQSPTEVAARVDELWKRRDEPAAFAQQKTLLEQAVARTPSDYGLLWRLARWYAWKGEEPGLSRAERANLGKVGWDLAERAVAINPNHVAAQFWGMAAMGAYALGLGILKALTQGIEGKFRQRLSRAERFDPGYAYGGIPVAWGSYYAKLPWPKYDEEKATEYFRKALAINPNNLRSRVYWAELHLREDRPAEAKRLLEEVLRATPGKYDAPEERRCQAFAARNMQKVNEALK